MGKNKKRDEKLRAEFLPEAMEIVEEPPSPLGHTIIYIITMLIVVVIIWSIVGKVDEIAIARGKTIPIDKLQVVQPVNEGVVSQLLVEEGSTVKKDDPLIILDSAVYEIDLAEVENTLDTLEFKNQLLKDFLNAKEDTSFIMKQYSNDLEKQDVIDFIRVLQEDYIASKAQAENDIQKNIQQVYYAEANLQKIKDTVTQLEDEQVTLIELSKTKGPEEQMLPQIELMTEVVEDEIKVYETLSEVGGLARYEVDKKKVENESLKNQKNVQQAKADYEILQKNMEVKNNQKQIKSLKSEMEIQEIQIEQAKVNLEQSRQGCKNLDYGIEKKVREIIVTNNEAIRNTTNELAIKRKNYENQILRAPVDGTIQSLGVNTLGTVIMPSQTVVTIVPSGSKVIVEALLSNKDIGFVHIGQEVSIKLDTFSFQKYGKLLGQVVEISPDAIQDETKGLVYRLKVELNQKAITIEDKEIPITPGMECTAEIKIGERRIIEFFFGDLMEYFDNSLKLK